ncbi:hypothetical protein Poli38472_012526 [Pythium oligandrum]|uniref:Uncharacterized protein n=1 Tax=Pythium oligandrum TaxID=41045 RepID=A0A8K1FF73_PYTOL|nr:hypothetical protein Poli38472_012526 [Pythium oligandrum]|eukprot:TMW61335.1 hypothetical protein Poli38472_012526 [Pythium oligandrum]
MAEIERLQRRRDELMSLHDSSLLCSRRRDACIAVTREYQDIFRLGYVAPRERDIITFTSTRLDQELFTFGGCGVEMLLEQWRRYTRTFPSIHIETHATEVTPLVDNENLHMCDAATTVGIVAVKGVVAGRIMRSTVATICPDIWRDPVLMHKLLEREIVCPTIWSFYFNPQGRVIRLDLNVDVFEGFRTVDDITLNDLVQVTQNLSIDDNSFLPPVLDNL